MAAHLSHPPFTPHPLTPHFFQKFLQKKTPVLSDDSLRTVELSLSTAAADGAVHTKPAGAWLPGVERRPRPPAAAALLPLVRHPGTRDSVLTYNSETVCKLQFGFGSACTAEFSCYLFAGRLFIVGAECRITADI